MENLEPDEFIGLFGYIASEELNNKLFLRWITSGRQDLSFAEFKAAVTPQPALEDDEIYEIIFDVFKEKV